MIGGRSLLCFIGLRMTPLTFTPFGFFSSTISTVQNGWENALHSVNIMPQRFFRLIPATILSFALLIIWLFVIVWVYRDAERRGNLMSLLKYYEIITLSAIIRDDYLSP